VLPLQFFPLAAVKRLVDTRTGAKFAVGEIRQYSASTISPLARAFAAGVQAVAPVHSGYLTVFAADSATVPTTSSVNYQLGKLTFGSVYSAVSASGLFKVRSSQSTHLVVDVTGYFAPAATGGLWFFSVKPHRFFDTRSGSPLSATARAFTVRGVAPVPATAVAISFAAALPKPTGSSELRIWPSGAAPATTAGVFNLGLTGETAGVVSVGSDNKIRLATKASTVHAAFDVDGYFAPTVSTASLGFVSLTAPVRLLDTRSTTWHGVKVLNVSVRPKLPTNAKVLVCTVEAISRNATGSLTIWPQGAAKPATSYLQYNGKLQSVMSLALNIPLSSTGGISIQSSCAGDVIIDVIGYYMPYNAPVLVRAMLDNNTTDSSSTHHHSGLSGVAVGLIVIGCIALAVAVVVIVIVVLARGSLRRRTNSIRAESYISMVANDNA